MSARAERIIGKAAGGKYVLDQERLGQKVIAALTAAGYRIIGTDEIADETVEAVAQAIKAAHDLHGRSYRAMAQAAVRSLGEGR